ncbi:MAG: cobyrinate a,c-diamide synthase [Hyphomonas sp.]|nr:cobyrinate a,c-diamide synthase [Hyphomonas sp.]
MRDVENRETFKMAKGLVIAAPHSGSGKTVFSMGLAAALKARGQRLQIAKGGPGYIDPQFLSAAIDQPCFNLDKWAMGDAQLRARVGAIAMTADFLLIEGMMGLFDGAAGMNGSTADLADTLNLPVLLVVDASGQAQSIAALVHGFATLRDRPKLCGVVATRVGSPRHGDMLADAVREIGVPFYGAVQRSDALAIPSRHLGLVQATEHLSQTALIDAAREAIERDVDVPGLWEAACNVRTTGQVSPLPPLGQRIAVARDSAFSFCYPHVLQDWRRQRVEIEFFSPLANESPSDHCDAVYLPGGYPELHGGPLAAADKFITGLQKAAARRALIYGECGGFMVLGKALIDADGRAHPMSGLLGHVTSFAERKLHLGYRELSPLGGAPWCGTLSGHEFHYSVLIDAGTDTPLFECADASGTDLGKSGGQRGSVMGSYMHIIDHRPI